MAEWTRSDPAAHQIVGDGLTSVFRIDGLLDPRSCPAA
jgi:hypothetical protein